MKVSCPICNKTVDAESTSVPFLNDDSKKMEYLYFRCCGYYRQKKFLGDKEIAKLYREDYDDFNLHPVMGIAKKLSTVLKAKKLQRHIAGKSVLEVGSSTGDFISQAKKLGPLSVHGIEISREASRITKKRFGIDLEVSSFENFRTSTKFDSIFMFHIIEHFKDPVFAAKKALGLLKKGGSLILETPSYDSWEQYLFGKDWYGWQVPFHTYLFSQKSLRLLLKKTGFKVEKTEHSNVPNSWVGSMKKRFPGLRRLGVLLLPLYGLFYIPALLAAKSHKGGRIIMYAYKK